VPLHFGRAEVGGGRPAAHKAAPPSCLPRP
ncbi:MAG: hypothetical protein AVDCRST_MAG86-2050, partial [uncultured Truepera sp.]